MRAYHLAVPCIAILLAGTALPAAAQYRDVPGTNGDMRPGQPMTLDAPPPPGDPAAGARAGFRSRYVQARSPRIVVFWNRELSDEVSDSHELYVRTNAQGRSSGEVSSESYDDGQSSRHDSRSDVTAETTLGARRTSDSRRDSAGSEASDFEIEQAFTTMLSSAGARLIDRTSIMRTTGVARGAGTDMQAIETKAILGKADIVLEVVQMHDDRTPDGVRFKVVARELAGGRMVTQFATDARPRATRRPLVAGPSGFVRAADLPVGPRDVGRQLAIETMSALGAAL